MKIKEKWLKYGLIGAAIYPSAIIIFLILSWIPFIGIIFSFIDGILLIPSQPPLHFFLMKCAIYSPGTYTWFRICYVIFPLIFSAIYGFIIGGLIGYFKTKK